MLLRKNVRPKCKPPWRELARQGEKQHFGYREDGPADNPLYRYKVLWYVFATETAVAADKYVHSVSSSLRTCNKYFNMPRALAKAGCSAMT